MIRRGAGPGPPVLLSTRYRTVGPPGGASGARPGGRRATVRSGSASDCERRLTCRLKAHGSRRGCRWAAGPCRAAGRPQRPGPLRGRRPPGSVRAGPRIRDVTRESVTHRRDHDASFGLIIYCYTITRLSRLKLRRSASSTYRGILRSST